MTDTAFAAPAATAGDPSAVFEPIFARIAEGPYPANTTGGCPMSRSDGSARPASAGCGCPARLTGSGTTVFIGVPVDPRFVTARSAETAPGSVLHATYQLVHLSALAGIAEAALRDITEFVGSRPRNLFNPAVAPREDPVSLRVLGESFGAVKTVRATVLAAATSGFRALDRHWRNARTISSRNPAIYRQQAVGNHLANGVPPAASLLALLAAEPAG